MLLFYIIAFLLAAFDDSDSPSTSKVVEIPLGMALLGQYLDGVDSPNE